MTTYGDEHYRDPYSTLSAPSNNCADLTGELLAAGGHPIPNDNTYLGVQIEVPYMQFNSLKSSNMGHLWNVFP